MAKVKTAESKPKKFVLELTQSRLKEFMTCERLEYYKYRAGAMGVGLKPVKTESFFVEGEFGHYALEHFYRIDKMLESNLKKRINAMVDELGELSPEEDDMYRTKLAAISGICNAYKMKYKSDIQNWKILYIEQPFEFTLYEDEGMKIVVQGKSDLGIEVNGVKMFVEHKFLSQFKQSDFSNLPINLQQLIYTEGFKQITGEYPDAYMWNVVQKTKLRLKQSESRPEYENRVAQDYIKEPEKYFFRPPPRKVEAEALESCKKNVLIHAINMAKMIQSEELPPMRYSSCQGKYASSCIFGPACLAESLKHKGNKGNGIPLGWDAPECAGLYRSKDAQHEELKGDA